MSADHPHLVHGLGVYFWDERPLRFIQKEANAETWMLTIIVQAIREAFLAAIADRRSSLVEAHSPAESPTTTDPVGRPKRRSPTKTKARRAKDKARARRAKENANRRLNKHATRAAMRQGQARVARIVAEFEARHGWAAPSP